MALGAANAPAQTPAKKSSPGAKAADRSFAPVHWDPAVPPTAYARNDPKQVFAWVKRKIDAVPGKSDVIESSKSATQNAYGARSMVTYTDLSELALGVPSGAMYEPAGAVVRGNYTATVMPYAYEFIYYTTAVSMPAAEARAKKSPFGCIAVASLEAPYLFSYEESESTTRIAPSLDKINGTGLLGRLDRVQVYDKASGKVYATHERDGL
ncbi:hypothetical protein RBA41_01725 [Massilia sp. CCM 9210]|uniref:hypothetical protein n=1 Tax=Massilia scottii TaxID=3057166 RepID=UPI002796940F|nr:hypothetical protein [Massilia sp. CCM 9210]MDQ1812014.1 hypothetical protein [Massilia sp. CCM 9210]